MPFVISHGPDLNAVGNIALQTGNAAYYNQIRREREAQAMADQQQRRSIYASLVQQGIQIRAQRERQILDQDFAREQAVRHQNFQFQFADARDRADDARQKMQQQFAAEQRLGQQQFMGLQRQLDQAHDQSMQKAGQDFQLKLNEMQQAAVQARHQEEVANEKARIAIAKQQAADMKERYDYDIATDLYGQEGKMVQEVEGVLRSGWGFSDGGAAWQAWQEQRKGIITNPTLRGRQRAEALLMHARNMPMPDKEPEPDPQEIIDNQVHWIEDDKTGRRFPVTVKMGDNGQWDVAFPSGWQGYGVEESGGNPAASEAENRMKYQQMAAKALAPRGELGENPTPEQINAYADALAGKQQQSGPGHGRSGTRYVMPRGNVDIDNPSPLTPDMLKNPRQLKVGGVYGPWYDPEVEGEVLYQWNGRDFDRIAPWNK